MPTFDLGKVVGDPGPQGETGPQGPQGIQGETGPQGPQGIQGETGPQGPQGTQGPAATIAVGQVTAGEPGSNPSVVNVGTETEAVLNFVIPRGEHGPQGETGPQGPQGIQGETGPQGTQGIQGIQGPQGPAGSEGPQGPAGPAGLNGADGKSAYESAQDGGYTGTESEFNTDLAGIKNKATKKVPAASGNLAALDANGDLTDSGAKTTSFDTAGAAAAVQGNLNTHINNKNNPHSVTAAQAGADPAGTASSAVSTHNAAADAHSALFADKADATHTHAAADIASGILSVDRGGTGVSTLAALATALGAATVVAGTSYNNYITCDSMPKLVVALGYKSGSTSGSSGSYLRIVVGGSSGVFLCFKGDTSTSISNGRFEASWDSGSKRLYGFSYDNGYSYVAIL